MGRRPPRRSCPSCRRTVYAWRDGTPCAECQPSAREHSTALVAIVRMERLARRAARGGVG